MDLSRKLSDDEMATPSKRFLSEDEKYSSFGSVNNSTNIKIATNKGEYTLPRFHWFHWSSSLQPDRSSAIHAVRTNSRTVIVANNLLVN